MYASYTVLVIYQHAVSTQGTRNFHQNCCGDCCCTLAVLDLTIHTLVLFHHQRTSANHRVQRLFASMRITKSPVIAQ